MTMGCFLMAFRIYSWSDSYGYVQLDYHRGGILVLLPTGILEDVEVFNMRDAIRLAGYNHVFRLLALHCFQKIDWCRYSGEDPPMFLL